MQNEQVNIILPKWLSNRGIVGYVIVLAVASFMFMNYSLHPGWMLIGFIEVFVFFFLGNVLSKKWNANRMHNTKYFEHNLFLIGVLCRFIMVMGIYFGFQAYYEDAFGFENADAQYYHEMGVYMADALRDGKFISTLNEVYEGTDLSDMGFFTVLSIIYFIFGNEAVLIPRFLNCIISAYSAVLIYRIGTRNFGQQVGRLAGILVMLWPNFWYYCGTQLKEPLMIFILVLFTEQVDLLLREQKLSVSKVVPVLLLAAAMFTIRTPLALVMILAFLFSVFMSSTRVIGWGKRIIIGILVLGLVGVTMGNRINEQAQELIERAQSDQQEKNMEWRTRRDNGNKFAKYAGAAVFAPLIFTIPFPTMVETPMQYNLKIVNGGNFCKNIISGFVIFALFSLLFGGKWRNHLMIISVLLGYLLVLVMSTFAQSERFHQVVVPFEMMFAAYGISLFKQGKNIFGKYLSNGNTKKYKRWFNIWSIVIIVACIAWQWFKLAGRGMA